MKVHVKPPPMSQAMVRVAAALEKYRPPNVEVVAKPEDADLQVLHVIGMAGVVDSIKADAFAVIQYCAKSANGSAEEWKELWSQAEAVWSYYGDLKVPKGTPYLHMPLGVDPDVFKDAGEPGCRKGIMSSGYVTGSCAEAIEEVADAAMRTHMPVWHLGPRVVQGMRPRRESSWRAVNGLSDVKLADLYNRVRWVSGLRRVEGFELPVLEGLACGVRPIVFNRPDMKQWYDGHAVFVDELEGPALTDALTQILRYAPSPVTSSERQAIVERFAWEPICRQFWEAVA